MKTLKDHNHVMPFLMKINPLLTACVVAVAITAHLPLQGAAFDWPQWQGPDRNAISQETGLLQEWPEAGPPLAWKTTSLGGGDSAPAIAAGRIYGMSIRGEDEVVWALSEADGSELWVTRLGPAHPQSMRQSQEGPGCTPTVDGDQLYVLGMGGALACLRVADGGVVWQKNLVADFAGLVPTWSYRESPLIDGEKLICTPGAEDALLVALDKRSGETVWTSKLPGTAEAEPAAPAAPAGPGRRGVPEGRGAPGASPSGGPDANTVAGTRDPDLFVSEHWGMQAFATKLPNGKYLARLYFAETYAGITGPGQRVFSFNVQGKQFKDFDIWTKAGGPRRAYIETVPVEVTDGEFRIAFTPQIENPAIKAIEVIPQSDAGSEAVTVRVNAGRSTPFTDSNGRVWQPDGGFEGGNTNPGTFAMAGGMGGFAAGNRGGGGAAEGRGGSAGGGRRGGFGGPRSAAGYASVIAIDFEGQRQYVQLTANSLIGVAASDGGFLWRYDRPANRMGINCSTPIYHDGMVFAASAYGAGGGVVKLSRAADGGITAEEMWFTREMENHHGGVVLIDGRLYGANGGNGGGYLICLDWKTGDVLWHERDRDKRRVPKGSVAVADNRIYYRTEDGTLLLIEPSSKEYLERGRFEQPDRTRPPAWAHPVIANGRLYVRDQDTLFCYNVKQPGN
jgi:outer membrane protein assembly factor BamB